MLLAIVLFFVTFVYVTAYTQTGGSPTILYVGFDWDFVSAYLTEPVSPPTEPPTKPPTETPTPGPGTACSFDVEVWVNGQVLGDVPINLSEIDSLNVRLVPSRGCALSTGRVEFWDVEPQTGTRPVAVFDTPSPTFEFKIEGESLKDLISKLPSSGSFWIVAYGEFSDGSSDTVTKQITTAAAPSECKLCATILECFSCIYQKLFYSVFINYEKSA
jgi:hypothetical protein